MKIVKYFFEFISIISLFCIFKIIGLRNASNVGSILGKFIGPLFRSKKIIKQNIKTGLGEIDEKKESEIKNFQLLQHLQEQIRKTLLLHEPISALKAFLSVTNNNENWNKVNPPLIKILHPKDHKTVMSLIELIKKMDELLSSA